MFLNSDFVDPATLTGYARAGVADMDINQFTLSRWLPSTNVDDLEYRFVRGGEGLVEAATFRAFDAESPVGARPGMTRVSGELPPISRKIRLGEYDRLRQRKAAPDTIAVGIYTDAERMTKAVMARIELARGDALTNGSVTLNENGVIATVSYGRTGGHTVTAGTLWSTVASATPLQDLLSWQTTYNTTNGVNPGALVISTTVLGYLLRNAEIRALAATTAGTPSLVSQDALRAVLQSYGLPPFFVYDAQVKVSGSSTRVIAANKALLLPAPAGNPTDTQLGATLFGTTAESLSPDYNLVGDEPGLAAGVYDTKDPVALWTKAAAIALPVLANPDLSFTATVA